jgi:serine phosphatase RsbU (regulator of sigma subunit)
MEVWGGNQTVDSSLVIAGLDMWVYSKPYGHAAAGGDVYYVSSCATGRITRLLVADVTGHGEAVGSLATGLGKLMRRFVNYIDQSRFVQSMNEQFLDLSKNGNFATAVVTTFFGPTRQLSLCNAGHPMPLLYEARKQKWSYLEHCSDAETEAPANLPLGVLDLSDYEQFEIEMEIGDLVLCYTDSLVEAYHADGRMLGQAGLLSVVRQTPVGDPETFVPRLLDRLRALRAGNLEGDDVTTLLFRPNGSVAQAPLSQRLLSPFRVVTAIACSWWRRDGASPVPQFSIANVMGALLSPLSRVRRRKRIGREQG